VGFRKNKPPYKRVAFWVGVLALWSVVGYTAFLGYAMAAPILHERLKGSSFELVFGDLPVIVAHNSCSPPCILNVTLTISHYDTWMWETELKTGQAIDLKTEGETQIFMEFFHSSSGYHYELSTREIAIQHDGFHTLRIHYDDSERTEPKIEVAEMRWPP